MLRGGSEGLHTGQIMCKPSGHLCGPDAAKPRCSLGAESAVPPQMVISSTLIGLMMSILRAYRTPLCWFCFTDWRVPRPVTMPKLLPMSAVGGVGVWPFPIFGAAQESLISRPEPITRVISKKLAGCWRVAKPAMAQGPSGRLVCPWVAMPCFDGPRRLAVWQRRK